MPVIRLVNLFILLVGLFGPTILRAADGPGISYLGIEHGLSNNSVTCIFQDHKGFMWFGTYEGLNRYDGYGFKVFRSRLNDSNSLPNNRIAAIIQDRTKGIWIGTRSGAARYDEVTSTFSAINYFPRGQKKPVRITATVNDLKTDHTGNVFIATDEGMYLYEETANAAVPLFIDSDFRQPASYQALSIDCDNKGNVWIYVREKGLYLYNSSHKTLRLVNDEIKNGICLKSDDNGGLWMGTDDGLYTYSIKTRVFSKLLSSGNRTVQLARYENSLFISCDGNGIFTYDCATGKVQPLLQSSLKQKLTSVCTSSVLKDRDGRLWIGTLRGGINVLDPEKNKFRTIGNDPLQPGSLVDNFVTACSEDSAGNLWIGTDGSGISYWNRKSNSFTNYRYPALNPQSRSSNFVTDVLTDYQHGVWFATWGGGIKRFDKKSGKFKDFACLNTSLNKEDKNNFLLFEDKQQRLWAGSCLEGGLYCFDSTLQKFQLYDYRLKNILAMYEDRSGKLWAGDFSSLVLIDQVNKSHKRYQVGYAIRSIFEDRPGNFWVGTEGGGLLLFEPLTGKMTRFSETEGLTNNAILKIVEDSKGYLWISTFNGLSLFNTVTKKFVNFSQSDGLQSNQFSYNAGLKLSSGEIVFGGIKGLNIFHPDSIINRKRPLTVLLSGLRVNDIPVQTADGYISKRGIDKIERITLPFDKAVLAIDFVALNYSASDKITYAYYLEGWDKGWSHVGKARTANYTRLNEGTYVFHVKAKDAATGDWNEWEDQLIIKILPPWYRAWWAYLLYITAGCTLIYLYIRYKSERNKQAYEIALARIETEKQKELNEKKLSFFTNIAHEFRAPLTLIIDPVKELLHNPEQRPGTVGLHIVYRNARRLLSLVDQLLLFRKAEIELDNLKRVRVNFYELCHEVFICFSHQATSRNIEYEFSGMNPSLELMVDPEKMEIILFNLLSNALKFTPAGGKVTFQIVETIQTPRMVEVIISDTGFGIDVSAGDRLFEKFYQGRNGHNATQKGFGIGLYLVSQFVHAHEGTIAYKSEKKTGTRFIMTLPYNEFSGQPAEPNDWSLDQSAGRKPVFLEELIADLEADADTGKSRSTPRTCTDDKRPALPDIISEKKSILLVDDNTGIREYLNNIFTDRFLVYEAESGEDGLELAMSHMPDIIISDVIMNGMTGVDFCTKIKADPELSHIPVILLTATTSSDIKLKGIECGAEDYITKPFEKELLIARVDNILKNRNTIQQYFLDTVTLRKNKMKVSGSYRDFLDRCIEVIEKEIDNENFTIKSFAHKMGMSHSSLYKKVKSVSGLSLNAFIRFLRLRKAALLLLSTDTNINEASFQVGFGDTKYFRSQFNKLFGMNPSEYIKKYKSNFNKDYNVVG